MNIRQSAKSSKSSWPDPYYVHATHWDFAYSEIIGSMASYLDIWCRYSTSPPVTKVHLEKSVWILAYGFITCYCLVCRFAPDLWLRPRICDDHHDVSFRPTRKLYDGDSFQLITRKHPKYTTNMESQITWERTALSLLVSYLGVTWSAMFGWYLWEACPFLKGNRGTLDEWIHQGDGRWGGVRDRLGGGKGRERAIKM